MLQLLYLGKAKSCCTFHRLGPLACSDLELTSETMNPFRHFGRTPWLGGLVLCKSSTYTGQHNTEKHGHISMP